MGKRQKNRPANDRRRLDGSRGRTRIVLLPLTAFVLTLIVESLSRASIFEMLAFMTQRPLHFAFNVLIVLTTLTFSELFKRRKSVLYVTCVIWLAMGIGELMVTRERTQPFTSMDLLMFGDAITLTTLYYTWPEIIAMFLMIFVAVVAVIWMITRLPKRAQVNYTLSLSVFAGLVTLCCCLCTLGVYFEYFPRHFDNLVDAYDDYGFATCFTLTFGDMGVERPADYSEETVEEILGDIPDDQSPQPSPTPGPHTFGLEDDLNHPNIIYVQLESLFDVNTIIGSEYSEDPTPNFNRLSREFPSAELYVPSIGGGTANMEFEMLSGMNMDFFGAGEYPYNTVLKDTTCETIAYTLLEQGYSTTAMHNHNGKFYSRNEIYGHLGFEKYVSLEYMPYVTYTDIGWAEDTVLTEEVLKALKATEERDFVMAVTVESHGKYDEEYEYREGDPQILALPEQLNKNRFANYLRLIHATDEFIGDLVRELTFFDEPVVCVFYGDHLPGLDLSADILTTDNIYASRYIIWNNFGGEFTAENMQAYQLSASLLGQLGIPGGVIARYHQAADALEKDVYLENLEVLQYDLLYGDRSGYENGVNPYEPTDIQMGSVPVEITSVSNRYGRVLVNGRSFTEYSNIIIDGELYPTAFVSSAQIVAIVPRTETVTQVEVAQITSDGVELGRTAPYVLESE